jgi:hypothetical protein
MKSADNTFGKHRGELRDKRPIRQRGHGPWHSAKAFAQAIEHRHDHGQNARRK